MGLSLGDIGTVIKVGGAVFGAFDDKKAGDENARLSREQAEREKERTRIELKRHRRDARKLLGQQRVQFGAAGVRLTGSALDVIADSAARAKLDASLIEAGGQLRENTARSEAKEFERRGGGLFRGGLLSATSILLEDK